MKSNIKFIFESPLSEMLRPQNLADYAGQPAIVSEGSILRKMIDDDNLSSFILWGPPGSGKTTLAGIIANVTGAHFRSFSAVTSGIKEVKELMQESEESLKLFKTKTIIFIDEIHRFNKAQQDAFLSFVEKGSVALIGATTENPSFSIISPLLSRLRVFKLNELSDADMSRLFDRAQRFIENKFNVKISIDPSLVKGIIDMAGGDARRMYGIIELSLKSIKNGECCENGIPLVVIDKETLSAVLQGRLPGYDKSGDFHYDYLSALHKSMRNSDPDAALYYAVKMLESGEPPESIMRRVIQCASEDVGLADPQALIISNAALDITKNLGMPEARYSILQATTYVALAPKSNSILEAYMKLKADIDKNPDLVIPLHLRNAPTRLMKELDYGKNYMYAHNYEIPVTGMQCLPDKLKQNKYYTPKPFGFEKELDRRLKNIEAIKNRMPED